jgi:hypothetical protein
MAQIITGHGVSGCFGTKLAPNTGEEADRACLPAPFLLWLSRTVPWAAMPPLWTPCAHKSPHTFGTSQCTLLPSDRLLPLVRSPSRTAYTALNIDGTSGRETVTPEPCNQHWSRTSVHNPPLSECDRVSHDAHRVSNNARLFGCTSHGSLGRAECTFSSRRPCDAPLGRAKAAFLTRRRTRHTPLGGS